MRTVILASLALAGCSQPPAGRADPMQQRKDAAARTPAERSTDPRCTGDTKYFWFNDFTPVPGGLIPDEKRAIQFGVAYMATVYPAERLREDRPWRANLNNGIWHVQGTLPPGSAGGTHQVELCRSNGRVLRFWAEQ